MQPDRAGARVPTPLGLACGTCHGATASAAHAVPLQSMSRDDIAAALRDYRDGRRSGTVMPRIAKPLDDATIAALAAETGASR